MDPTKLASGVTFRQVLIKGTLKGDGQFVPQVGCTILLFSTYRYSETAPRIYNLPGRFEKVE